MKTSTYAIRAVVEISSDRAVADALRTQRTSVTRSVRRGATLSSVQAERVAIRLGLDPADIWPEWAEAEEPALHIPPAGEWVRRGACRGASQDKFFPERGEDVAMALAVCERCPVQPECLAYALDQRELVGIWGGTTGNDRRRIRSELGRNVEVAEEVA